MPTQETLIEQLKKENERLRKEIEQLKSKITNVWGEA
jgi:hypothetical protein